MDPAPRIIAIAISRVPNTVRVTASSTLFLDLGWDYPDVVNFIRDVEDELSVTILDDKIAGFGTIDDVIEFVRLEKYMPP